MRRRRVGFAGGAHERTIDVGAALYGGNIGVRGGIRPAGACIPEVLPDVLPARLDAYSLLGLTVPLEECDADTGDGRTRRREGRRDHRSRRRGAARLTSGA